MVNGVPLIVLDPGHGGTDPGATGNGLAEKNITLDITTRARDRLKAHGFLVEMTRTDDRYVGLSERAAFANRLNADYFLSVHINAGGGTGYESYVQPGYDSGDTGRIRAQIHQRVAEFFATHGLPDRGKKQMDLAVTRETVMPASLHECGFIDSGDARFLADPNFRQGVAEALVHGVCDAFGIRYYPPQPAQPAPAPQPSPQPAPQPSAVQRLKDMGLVDVVHEPSEPVNWGQLADIILRLKS